MKRILTTWAWSMRRQKGEAAFYGPKLIFRPETSTAKKIP